MITVLATARISSYSHHLPNDPAKQTLHATLEFYDGVFIDNVRCIPNDEILDRSHSARQRRLAFDIEDGHVVARLPVRDERRRVLTGPNRQGDLALLRETVLSGTLQRKNPHTNTPLGGERRSDTGRRNASGQE